MRHLIIVTGASRGFGRAVAEATAAAVPAGAPLHVVLLSRDAAGMAGTADAVRAAHAGACVTAATMDMCDLYGIEPAWHAALAAAAGGGGAACPAFDTALLVHNAGSLGEVARIRDVASLAGLRASVDANVTSTVWLTALFLRLVRGPHGPRPAAAAAAATATHASGAGGAGGAPPCVVLNVSSLAAVQAMPTNGVYCVGKAARDMLHAVVAAEAAAGDDGGGDDGAPAVRTLSYAPGPMDTNMQAELRASAGLHPPTLALFQRLKAEGGLVDVRESAAKCARVLREGRFVSGSHLDFYDPEP